MKLVGSWKHSLDHRQPCKVIDEEDVWGRRFARVWLPRQDVVVRVAMDRLGPMNGAQRSSDRDHLIYLATAAKLADCLNHNTLLAPAASRVIPLPHQIRALQTAVAGERVRFLLADEVGLGKTIEAGLIIRELKMRGLVRRVLVVAPKGLCQQWVSEMDVHFSENFRLLMPEDLKSIRRLGIGGGDRYGESANPWRTFDQVICPLDSVKPMDKRKGWSPQKVAEYNQERFDDLVCAGWDLVVVDESHRLGGATDQVARYKLGRGLGEASPYLLLLSATPHQGKSDGFRRLISLLDPESFMDEASISRESVRPYVIRTEKRFAVTAEGLPLFQPRQTRRVAVEWAERHAAQRTLYEAVSEYVRLGYNQAMKEKKTHIGFLLVLMQRLVTSSTRAIRVSLERRLEALKGPDEQLTFFPAFEEDEWGDLDGQEQLDTLLKTRFKAMKNERAEVAMLLDTARKVEAMGADAKAEALLDWIYKLQQEETNPDLKILIFTEFVPTQAMLADFFGDRGFSVTRLNGSLDMDERKRVQQDFRSHAQMLVSTDAGGEGLNLQFCHVVVNFDIPWNPMRMEQRIGRVDRIGQTHPVKALNLVLSDTVEYRVREVLEQKLAVILTELGIDKTSDVLDSADAEALFDQLYVDALLEPETIETKVREMAQGLSEKASDAVSTRSLLGGDDPLDGATIEEMRSRPIQPWVHRMTAAYVRSNDGQWAERPGKIECRWPDGTAEEFSTHDGGDNPLDLQHPRVRELCHRIPLQLDAGETTKVTLPDLPQSLVGTWSLWQIIVQGREWRRHRLMPLFITDAGQVLHPSAQRIWEQVIDGRFEIQATSGNYDPNLSLRDLAMREATPLFNEVCAEYRRHISADTTRREKSLAARRRLADRVGLESVRAHRLRAITEEEREWRNNMPSPEDTLPEFNAVITLQVQGGHHG